MIALVDPPSAISAHTALPKAAAVSTWLGRSGARARTAARRPVATAWRRRAAEPDGGVAPPGSISPSASVRQAMVEAVPITMQVPPVGHNSCCTCASSSSASVPARYCSQWSRQSVQAPSRVPRQRPVRIGPVTSASAGTSADAAAISCAGTVLSQPPISTAASMG